MTVDEMIVQVRVTADGVKQGVAVAKAELKKLEDAKKKLQEELKMKVSSPELTKLRQELTDLQAKKKALDSAVKFPVDSDNVRKLKEALSDVADEKKMIEGDLKMPVSLPDMMAAEAELERLETEKKRLEEETKITLKTDAEAAKNDLNQVNRAIENAERNITLHMESSGINQTAQEIKALDAGIQQAEQSAAAMEQQLPKIAMVATAVFAAVVVAVGKGTEAFNKYTATMNGLASQMDHIGVSMETALDVVKEKTADGLVSESDIAMSIKNLTRYGLTIEQTSAVLDRLKDSATNNREAHYGLGEAIRVTTEGIKNENSRLADAAGVTKNISKMHEEYAKSIGSTVDNLTEAERAQAIYNGIMAETEAVVGNAAEYAKTLAGAQAEQDAAALKLAQTYGSAVAPAVQVATEAFTGVLQGTREF
ncbi:MAG: hypothetical protein LBU77_01930, partial [Clostridiales bacterium]|nr:hypothetical protein [Clostridiales bacterium]